MKPLPKPVEHNITIPDGLPDLPGNLTRRARVEVALDVIAVLKSRQRKLQLASMYFEPYYPDRLPKSGQLHTSRIGTTCDVCARGILFLKTVDRFDQCAITPELRIRTEVINRSVDDWGREQAYLIETAFEGGLVASRGSYYADTTENFRALYATDCTNRKPLMIAICQNIVDNHGEFKP